MDIKEEYNQVMNHPYRTAIPNLEDSLCQPLDILCEICGTTRQQVMSMTRKINAAQARHALYCWTYMSLVPNKCKMVEVAHFFGIHHSSLLYAKDKIESLEMSQTHQSFCGILLRAFDEYERRVNERLTSAVRDTLAHVSL